MVDCSLTLSWCFEDQADEHADGLLEVVAASEAVVPAIWPLEVANSLLVSERAGRLTEADSERFLDFLATLPIRIDEADQLESMTMAISVARSYRVSAYDASYLELAMRLGASFATRDRKLAAAARRAGVKLA